jgi:hypothetical protein
MELQTNHGDKQMDKDKDTAVEAILELNRPGFPRE